MCVCVCLMMTVCICVTCRGARAEWGEGSEEKKVGRGVGGWFMCVYASLLCEIKHANGGLF